MIHAYDKVYLEKARVALGRMLDFAVFDLKYDISDFFARLDHPDRDNEIISVKCAELFCHAENCTGAELKW